MSKTVVVSCGDRWFWAYDVSLGILLLEGLHVAAGKPLPPGADAVLEDLSDVVRLGANIGLNLDGWNDERRAVALDLIADAGRRFRGGGVITAAEAEGRYRIDGEPYFLRGQPTVDRQVIAEVADAIERLVRGELPDPPDPDRHWFFGWGGEPRLL